MLGPILALVGGRWWIAAVVLAGLAMVVAGPLLELRGLRARLADEQRVVEDLRAGLEEQTKRAQAGARALDEARRQVAEHVARERRAAAAVQSSGDVERQLRRELDTIRGQLARRQPRQSAPCDCAPMDDALDLLRKRQQSAPGGRGERP